MRNFYNYSKFFIIIVFLSFILNGCGLLFSGTRDKVSMNSEPKACKVYINGTYMGTTPLEINLDSDKSYTIEFKKEGYETRTVLVSSKVAAGYVILDILGGLIPIIIDASTGGWYVLDETNVNATLEKK